MKIEFKEPALNTGLPYDAFSESYLCESCLTETSFIISFTRPIIVRLCFCRSGLLAWHLEVQVGDFSIFGQSIVCIWMVFSMPLQFQFLKIYSVPGRVLDLVHPLGKSPYSCSVLCQMSFGRPCQVHQHWAGSYHLRGQVHLLQIPQHHYQCSSLNWLLVLHFHADHLLVLLGLRLDGRI